MSGLTDVHARARPVCILITGMSGAGKSAVIDRLARAGHDAIDTDYGGYSILVDAAGELTGPGAGKDWVWDEGRIDALLTAPAAGQFRFVAGCAPNQSHFYPHFDGIVLLTTPAAVLADRLATRRSNRFGKQPGELQRTLALKDLIEPRLRRRADFEIDTSNETVAMVATSILAFAATRTRP